MPTYDYACKTCGHRFEYFQSISSDALTNCPAQECAQTDPAMKGTGEVTRLISGGAGLVFRGEGFYLTDYVRKGGSEKGEGGKGGSSSSSGSSSASGSSSGGSSGGGSGSSGGGSSSGSSGD